MVKIETILILDATTLLYLEKYNAVNVNNTLSNDLAASRALQQLVNANRGTTSFTAIVPYTFTNLNGSNSASLPGLTNADCTAFVSLYTQQPSVIVSNMSATISALLPVPSQAITISSITCSPSLPSNDLATDPSFFSVTASAVVLTNLITNGTVNSSIVMSVLNIALRQAVLNATVTSLNAQLAQSKQNLPSTASSSSGAIVGAIVGVILAIVIGILIYVIYRRRQNQNRVPKPIAIKKKSSQSDFGGLRDNSGRAQMLSSFNNPNFAPSKNINYDEVLYEDTNTDEWNKVPDALRNMPLPPIPGQSGSVSGRPSMPLPPIPGQSASFGNGYNAPLPPIPQIQSLYVTESTDDMPIPYQQDMYGNMEVVLKQEGAQMGASSDDWQQDNTQQWQDPNQQWQDPNQQWQDPNQQWQDPNQQWQEPDYRQNYGDTNIDHTQGYFLQNQQLAPYVDMNDQQWDDGEQEWAPQPGRDTGYLDVDANEWDNV